MLKLYNIAYKKNMLLKNKLLTQVKNKLNNERSENEREKIKMIKS